MDGVAVYLASLAGSWRALAVPHPDARVVTTPAFLASVSPRHPVLNNAAVLHPEGVAPAAELFGGAGPYALWSWDPEVARALESAGYRRDAVTYPMVVELADVVDPGASAVVRSDVGAEVIADLNSVSPLLLAGVPGLRTYATAGLESGAALIEVGADVNVSFVATRPAARRRGLAAAVVATALREAADDGFRTSSLQATESARGVYARLGYRSLGRWQEWIEPSVAPNSG